jgi:small nuclear ribonucleoprotein (snRNP)-like protein
MAAYKLNLDLERTTILDVLEQLKGKPVILAMRSGVSYSGKLTMIGKYITVISEISGKEYYDEVISTSDIVGVEYRARESL